LGFFRRKEAREKDGRGVRPDTERSGFLGAGDARDDSSRSPDGRGRTRVRTLLVAPVDTSRRRRGSDGQLNTMGRIRVVITLGEVDVTHDTIGTIGRVNTRIAGTRHDSPVLSHSEKENHARLTS
jgi:hypothetical protein